MALDQRLWAECLRAVQLLSRGRGAQPASVDGNRVLVADFNALKVRPDTKGEDPEHPHMDTIEGANDVEANWVRKEFGKNVLLVDSNIHPRCWPYILLHEALERRLMTTGMSYNAAHERANAMEREARLADAARRRAVGLAPKAQPMQQGVPR